LMLTKQPFRTFLLHDRACSALWVARDAAAPRRAAMLRQAQANARSLQRQRTRWAHVMGLSISTVISHAQGHRERALEQALVTERGLEELGMSVYAAAMTKRRGELLGGAMGASLVDDAEARLRRAGITATTQMADMLVPPVLGW
jgi:hypothetical protein